MDSATVNFVLAAAIWLFAVGIGVSHLMQRGLRGTLWYLGTATVLLATVTLLTAAPSALGISRDQVDVLRVVVGFLRGSVLVLLGAYVILRWTRYH